MITLNLARSCHSHVDCAILTVNIAMKKLVLSLIGALCRDIVQERKIPRRFFALMTLWGVSKGPPGPKKGPRALKRAPGALWVPIGPLWVPIGPLWEPYVEHT